MAISTSIITGRFIPATDVPFNVAYLVFTLSGYDNQGAQMLPGGSKVR